MELLQGRPEDCSGRLDKEIRVYDFLDRLGISYQRIDHDAATLRCRPPFARICCCAIGRILCSIC